MKNTYSYVDALNEVLTLSLSDQCRDKLTALRDQVAKRNASKSDKPTKTQRENEGVKQEILAFLNLNASARCGDIAIACGISGQKCSALLTQLVKDGTVTKFEGEKRVTLFKLTA
jgi:predicted transcriptional regulator